MESYKTLVEAVREKKSVTIKYSDIFGTIHEVSSGIRQVDKMFVSLFNGDTIFIDNIIRVLVF